MTEPKRQIKRRTFRGKFALGCLGWADKIMFFQAQRTCNGRERREGVPSCPGSARARPAWQALPACGRSDRGRASRPLRSQAEPGNEKSPGTKAVGVGTRKAI